MAKACLLLLLVSVLYIVGTAKSTATASPKTTNFVKSSCSATTYPAVCVKSLSTYATAIQQSPHQMALTALSVSIDKAGAAKTFVTKLGKLKGLKSREYKAIKDCVDEMGDSVDRLSQSVQELQRLGGKSKRQDFLWHMSNVQTWVSAALTDENTCLDGFAGKALNGKIKASIRQWVVNVAQVTSNALALCNRFAAKY
ncbi:hypothetical protein FNV43_RR24231 [Rhamnella rubrinervis]|uniref:Pectinesterase inhibitor domain-containing protein n=1 Tax=Rhamnella rubrinervis TaxID=2594499 RepID=A0A8K0DS44_9ROSA|nr:hypothetical protein FNV43_RR24231 [Rhamnella rubrinervis]